MKRLTKEICGRAHGEEGVSEDKLTGAYCRGEFEATAIVERLFAIEEILGDDYDLDLLNMILTAYRDGRYIVMRDAEQEGVARLKKISEADCEGRCIVPPAKIGDTVYHITTCENFWKVLDGTMYDADGGEGTATGYYCPCELAENCPFPLDDDGGFDCDEHKKELGIFEDVVTGIVIDDTQEFLTLGYSGNVWFCEFGKTVFKEKESAVSALEEMRK